jgi:hypothetical protein
MIDHIRRKFGRLWEEREGGRHFLERRRRKFFLSNLERERRRKYEDLAPKSLIYSLVRKYSNALRVKRV